VIGAFLTWWLAQLTELLPWWLRPPVLTRVDALVIAPVGPLDRGTNVTVTLRRHGKDVPLGQFAVGAADLKQLSRSQGRLVILKISHSDVLEKTIVLPLAAQRDLDQVLAFEMDRETPFTEEELYWTYQTESVDQQLGRLSVHLLLIQKSRLTPLLTALSQCGLAPTWLEFADGPPGVPFLPLNNNHSILQRRPRWLLAGAAGCCAALALGAVVLPFARQTAELSRLDREVRAGQATAAEAEALRGEIVRLSRSAKLVVRAQQEAARPLEALAIVTRLLPDDTYLTGFEVRQRKMTLNGHSAGAARLIRALAADGRFPNPSFAAPVTRVEALKADVFTIVTEIGPPR
jgi:general secretion pathway protein L